jgi:hypothetical protein
MPNGTRGGTDRRKRVSFANVPLFPPNLFAVAAYLLHVSGAYHYVVMDSGDDKMPRDAIAVTSADRTAWIDHGKRWAQASAADAPPAAVRGLWRKLRRCFGHSVFMERRKSRKWPRWWKTAYALMAIADEASADLGYLGLADLSGPDHWISRVVRDVVTRPPIRSMDGSLILSENVSSIATEHVDPDVVCVQAKARTPNVGAAVRNISHNLALLPPRGEMSVHWQAPFSDLVHRDDEPLNVLLVPFPYAIRTDDFRVVSNGLVGAPMASGWFRINQSWLEGGSTPLVRFVEALIETARVPINAIVFPELALNWTVYKKLAQTLRDGHPDVELLVAGSSTNCNKLQGNFALATHFFPTDSPPTRTRTMASMSRSKHHRWALTRFQVGRYGLDSSFASSPKETKQWWECIDLNQREIHVNAFRRESVFSVMICEDLARSDPAHEPLRAVGPNLVFVILMDGPQTPKRWSARYSLGLADDPGCSVLTLTSRALIERANNVASRGKGPWNIALWQAGDDYRPKKIVCAAGAQAVVVTLVGEPCNEATLDGRTNTQTRVWQLSGAPKQIRLGAAHKDLCVALGAW